MSTRREKNAPDENKDADAGKRMKRRKCWMEEKRKVDERRKIEIDTCYSGHDFNGDLDIRPKRNTLTKAKFQRENATSKPMD